SIERGRGRPCRFSHPSEVIKDNPFRAHVELSRARPASLNGPISQHLACIRMLFGWLVTGQVIAANPAHAVRGPRHSVMKGSTTVMSSQEATAFLNGIDVSHVVGLRDRA